MVGVIVLVAIVVLLATLVGVLTLDFSQNLGGDGAEEAFKLEENGEKIKVIKSGEQESYDVLVDGEKMTEIPGKVGSSKDLSALPGQKVSVVDPKENQVIQTMDVDGSSDLSEAHNTSPNCGSISYTKKNGYNLVTNDYELQCIGKHNSSGKYKLANNIDASGTSEWNSGSGFKPISKFDGELVGNSKTIQFLYINRSNSKLGLFKENKGLLRDFTLSSATVINKNSGDYTPRIGTLVGNNSGNIEKVNSLNLDIKLDGDSIGVGGLVGYAYEGEIISSKTSGNMRTDNYGEVGGLVGIARAGGPFGSGRVLIKDSSSSIDIEPYYWGGGLVGNAIRVDIVDSSASGEIYAQSSADGLGGLVGYSYNADIRKSSATGDVYSYWISGGLLGEAAGKVNITSSKATGDIIEIDKYGKDGSIGGLVGEASKDSGNEIIKDSKATGDVKAIGEEAGGIVGKSIGYDIIDSEYTGDIDGAQKVGGIIGHNEDGSGDLDSLIKDSEASGKVNGSSQVGGISGCQPSSNAEIKNSQYTGPSSVPKVGSTSC